MKILIPTDGSKHSEAAIREVASQIWPEGSQARVLYAVELYPRNLHGASLIAPERYEEIEHLDRDRSKSFIDEAVEILVNGGFRPDDVSTSVVLGSPKRVILDEAEEWKADLIVVGSHGDGPIKRFLIGSVSLAVAMHAPCSVRVVRPRYEDDDED